MIFTFVTVVSDIVLAPQPLPRPWTTDPRRFIQPFDVPAALLALLFAAFVVIGASFQATDSTAWFASSPGAAAGSALAITAIAAALYVPVHLIYAWLDRRWGGDQQVTARVMPMRRAVARWLLPTFGVLLVGWLPWLLVHYPGDVDSDTTNQLLQWLGLLPRSDHHPWFDTIIFGWFFDIGRAVGSYNVGLFTYLVFQVAATALGMALVLTYLGRLGLDDRLRRILTAFAALFPVFAMSGSQMSKDSFAGILWLPFLVLFVETVRTRGLILCRPWIGVGAVALAIPLILARRPNVYVFALCVLVLLLIAVRPARKRLLIGAGLVLFFTSLVWPRIVLPSLDVEPGTTTDMYSVPVQQTARTVARHGNEIPASERAAIDAVLTYHKLDKAYAPRKSDAVKARWNNEATTAQKLAYARVWFAQFTRYPGTYVAATANNTFQYFTPVSPVDYPRELTNQRRYVDWFLKRSVEGTTRQQIEAVAFGLYQPSELGPVRTAVNRVTMASISGNFFASAAFYCSWLPLFALGFALRRRSAMLALATVPLFVNLLILVAGPVVGGRYMIPMLLGSVLIAGLMMVPVALRRPSPIDGGAVQHVRQPAVRDHTEPPGRPSDRDVEVGSAAR
jgi:Family of unknown function (DUF6020)